MRYIVKNVLCGLAGLLTLQIMTPSLLFAADFGAGGDSVAVSGDAPLSSSDSGMAPENNPDHSVPFPGKGRVKYASGLHKSFGLLLSILFVTFVILLIGKQRLSLDYAWPWFIVGVVMGGLSLGFNYLVVPVADALGIMTPVFLPLLLAIIFLLLIVFYLSMRLSKHDILIKNLMQEVGIANIHKESSKSKE